MTRSRAVWIFLALLTAIRLALLGSSELTGDEAHYWMWSQRLAPSYFSKGPGIALVIRGGTALFGDSEFGVRFWSPILAAGTSILLFYFARRLFSETTAFWTVIALNVTPIFNIGSFVMTIDPLSIFFWVAAMFVFWLAVEKTPDFTLWWPLAGLCVGLGFLCKYTNALELVSIALVLALAPRLRREWKRPGIYALLSVFALCTLPPIIWNAQHDWITIAHLRARGSLDETPGFHPLETLVYLGEHFVTYSPLLFGGLIIAVIANRRRFRQQFKVLFLVWFGLPVFLFYLLLSLNKAAAPNWDGLAFLSLGVLAVSYWREQIEARAGLKYWAAVALLLALGMSALALDSDLLRTFGVNVARRDPSDRMRGWRAAAA
ncbi:MAG TPA: glycosyltransferase family 39 protein, partial [Chthoniobacterales bacterium]|nr:glycosyltransferase family 39 protein [Chthoniobacterales bacterium]